MRLTRAHVTTYKSIDDAGDVLIEPTVTVLVGQNESGKTAFLEALHKARSAEEGVKYDVVEDYPRKGLSEYEAMHTERPADVVRLAYALSEGEIEAINDDLGLELLNDLSFVVTHKLSNTTVVQLTIPERKYVEHLLATSGLPAEVRKAVGTAKTVRDLIASLSEQDLNEEGTTFRQSLQTTFPEPKSNGWSLLDHHVWAKHIRPKIPKFLYFDDYKLMPGKTNLQHLSNKRAKGVLSDADSTVLGLLHLARIDLDKLLQDGGYEQATARLEGISNSISDKIFKYWTQNQRGGVQELEVKFDIKADPTDEPPFDTGSNLYIRIRSLRHRVSVPFDKRSKGFIWFFSFLVWFDSIREQVDANTDLILLLDEPGLSLHALAQADLLRYIENLAQRHQVLYTTHSPFMVRSDRLNQVRAVEDDLTHGTLITSDMASSSDKTVFPLQAALGYTVAQNLFISRKNLLVEGPADLIYLQFFSDLLRREGRTGLVEDVVIVPVGGLDKLATFIALLGANGLDIVVVHDWSSAPDQRLNDLVQRKLIDRQRVINFGDFRSPTGTPSAKATDIEDLLNEAFYLHLFNAVYGSSMPKAMGVKDLEPGDRVVERIERTLVKNGLSLRPSGGYNHYRPAAHLASHPPARAKIGDSVLDRFEALFNRVNRLFLG